MRTHAPHIVPYVTIRPEINSNDFGCFWNQLKDSNSIFVVADFFLNDSNLWCVQSSNLTQCGRTCACAVACLHPHNSMSNVVVSLIFANVYACEHVKVCVYLCVCIYVCTMFLCVCIYVSVCSP